MAAHDEGLLIRQSESRPRLKGRESRSEPDSPGDAVENNTRGDEAGGLSDAFFSLEDLGDLRLRIKSLQGVDQLLGAE